jgi:peptidoglycan-associated lipoprotein
MKTSNFLSVIFVTAALSAGSTGCAHKPYGTTFIPNSPNNTPVAPPPEHTTTPTPEPPPGPTLTPAPALPPGSPIPEDTNGPWSGVIANHNDDVEKFKSDTVYFELDSSTIKKSEDKKLGEVADYFKTNTEDALRVEGNCDERGTEKYNLALGERRALAVREYLSNLGVDPRRIVTVTYGAAKPAKPGHDESAWSKNRRGDFILMTPKK